MPPSAPGCGWNRSGCVGSWNVLYVRRNICDGVGRGAHASRLRQIVPKGFYGMGEFMQSIDTTLFGRKTYDVSLLMGAKFDSKTRNYVF